MSTLKALWADLVDKRLWPVAVALLVALIAVPVLIGGGGGAGSHAGQAAATAPSTPAAPNAVDPVTPATDSAVSTATDAHVANRAGAVRNPFSAASDAAAAAKDPAAAASTATTAATATAAPAGATTPTSASGLAKAVAGVKATPGSATATTKPIRVPTVAGRQPLAPAVTVRMKASGKGWASMRNVPRLAALPSAHAPLAFYLGARSDRRAGVFALVPGVSARGGHCVAAAKVPCAALELAKGQSALLTITRGARAGQHERLGVSDVVTASTTSLRTATASLLRRSEGGELLAAQAVHAGLLPGAQRYVYVVSDGTLHRLK